MIAAYLVKNGPANKAFELREIPIPVPASHEVLIKVEGFGLNYADVLARLGHYRECPPLPTIIGYESVGSIISMGSEVQNHVVNQRVMAITKFGSYAEYVLADARAVVPIPESMSLSVACSMAVQYCTAYYSAAYICPLQTGDHILIHAAAGGVGNALIQLAQRKGCTIFGTAGTDEKIKYLANIGVDHPINYKKTNYELEVKKIGGNRRLDVIFNPIGGKSIKRGMKLLSSGGRMICYGISGMNDHKNILSKYKYFYDFGFYHPGFLMMRSKSIIGVNMLKIGEYRPEYLLEVMNSVVELYNRKEINPKEGTVYPFDQLQEAHSFLESGKSIGKIALEFDANT